MVGRSPCTQLNTKLIHCLGFQATSTTTILWEPVLDMEFLCQVLDYVSMTGFVYAAQIKEMGLYLLCITTEGCWDFFRGFHVVQYLEVSGQHNWSAITRRLRPTLSIFVHLHHRRVHRRCTPSHLAHSSLESITFHLGTCWRDIQGHERAQSIKTSLPLVRNKFPNFTCCDECRWSHVTTRGFSFPLQY